MQFLDSLGDRVPGTSPSSLWCHPVSNLSSSQLSTCRGPHKDSLTIGSCGMWGDTAPLSSGTWFSLA